ncbi:hypothetical protein J6590_043365, partial [Homalodisca vitripennis]
QCMVSRNSDAQCNITKVSKLAEEIKIKSEIPLFSGTGQESELVWMIVRSVALDDAPSRDYYHPIICQAHVHDSLLGLSRSSLY